MRHFLLELEELQQKLLEMGGLVESSIRESVLTLVERRPRRAENVWSYETRINRLEIEIDELATRLLALQQPIAGDLRFITAAIKINTDLERMGDLAVNIAQRAQDLIEKPPLQIFVDIPELARSVLLSDDEVDRLRTSIYEELIAAMQKDPAMIVQGVDLILISRHLERIADHATNIAEDTLFLVRGVDVRHHAESSV